MINQHGWSNGLFQCQSRPQLISGSAIHLVYLACAGTATVVGLLALFAAAGGLLWQAKYIAGGCLFGTATALTLGASMFFRQVIKQLLVPNRQRHADQR